MDTIKLDLVTPVRRLISTEVEELTAKAFEGEVEILPGHANYITLLNAGALSFTDSGKKREVAVSGGFMEVSLNHGIRVMAEAAEFAENIDVKRAESAKERAQRRISDFDPARQDLDIARAEAALKRALNRLQVAERADLGE
jgi:F-type H+-transporting ATPase subunit epsilon